MINYEELHQLAHELAVPVAVQSFPNLGEAAIRAVYRFCRRVFQAIDPSQLQGEVVIFSAAQLNATQHLPPGKAINDVQELQEYVGSGFALEVDPATNLLRVWPNSPPAHPEVLSQSCVVFVHDNGNEVFRILNTTTRIPRIFQGKQSFFSVPNYANLADALAYYRLPMVRDSRCPILNRVWYDENRLFLREKPEDTIQESLHAFLQATLRNDAEVMREQNVDESHPVDIRITFHFTNRVALIEVKWLGKSKHPDGTKATEYSASRAVSGSHQLAEYLEAFSKSSPFAAVQGYLVILDARRWGLSDDATSINNEDGMYYQDKEIDFDPRYDLIRNDFNEPIRMFAKPICS